LLVHDLVVMLLEKTRSIKQPRIKSKGLSLEIRCKANVLPLKSMLYAIAHARQTLYKPKNSNASLYAHKLTSQMRDLSSMINSLNFSARPSQSQLPPPIQPSNPENPDEHSRGIESAINTYVDLFYNIHKDERKSYIESFNQKKNSKIKPERNLLIIPALMAELKMPKEDVSKGLFYSLYKMPFKMLYDSSKSALHVALLEQNMAIRTVPYDTVEKFSKSMSKLDARIKSVEKGEIKPQEDEDLKIDFIDKAIEFSKTTEINIIDLIAERVGTESAMNTRMHRIMRRAKY
jgi:hypothetical protein